jgi:hypothetical protein
VASLAAWRRSSIARPAGFHAGVDRDDSVMERGRVPNLLFEGDLPCCVSLPASLPAFCS